MNRNFWVYGTFNKIKKIIFLIVLNPIEEKLLRKCDMPMPKNINNSEIVFNQNLIYEDKFLLLCEKYILDTNFESCKCQISINKSLLIMFST